MGCIAEELDDVRVEDDCIAEELVVTREEEGFIA